MADEDEVSSIHASSLNAKSKQANASRIFFIDKEILDKTDRMTEFFGRCVGRHQKRDCVRVCRAYFVPLLGALTLLRGVSAAARLAAIKILVKPPTRFATTARHRKTDQFVYLAKSLTAK